jgi:hypothetical protein
MANFKKLGKEVCGAMYKRRDVDANVRLLLSMGRLQYSPYF